MSTDRQFFHIHLWVGCLAISLLFTGCANRKVQELGTAALQAQGPSFTQALANEYLVFAKRELDVYYDQVSAYYFAQKGIVTAQGKMVEPETIHQRRIPADQVPELESARSRLMQALMGDATNLHPQELAKAQVSYDCWVEEQEENIQPDNIQACKVGFYQYIMAAENVPQATPQTYSGSEALLPIAPYSVYYGINKADVTPDADNILTQLVALLNQVSEYRIVVEGYTDRTGSSKYNLKLSQKRVDNVRQAAVNRGALAERVRGLAYGDSKATGKKGVHTPQDRRVDITLFVPERNLMEMSGR